MDYYSNKGGPWANYGTHSGHGGRWVVRKRMVKNIEKQFGKSKHGISLRLKRHITEHT